ncbi:MAG: hypothetical protein SF123_19630 [Chloroflexota bacterium]|nr:hypothetical protein [Chloroflexota bacterium]
MEGLTEGRIVHFVLDNGAHRPATVVNAWKDVALYQSEGRVNLLVFLDGENDAEHVGMDAGDTWWRTSVPFSDDKTPGTWHWM